MVFYVHIENSFLDPIKFNRCIFKSLSLLQFSKNCKKAQRILLCILKRFAVITDSAIEVSWVVSNRVTISPNP